MLESLSFDPKALLFQPVVTPAQRLAPMPPHRPFVGHFLDLDRDILAFLPSVRASCGDIARLQFGPRVAHQVSHPELIKAVLSDGAKRFGKAGTPGASWMTYLLGDGLLTAEGPLWLRQRRIAQPAFHRRTLPAFGPTFVDATREALRMWPLDRPTDAHGQLMGLTLRIVARTLLGADVSGVEGEVSAAVDALGEEATIRSRALWSPPLEWPLPRHRALHQHLAQLDRIIYRMIAERRRTGLGDDLLSRLLAARDPETGEAMSDRQLRDEALTIFLAGHETTANALSFTLHLLGLHPHIQRELRDELRGALGDGPATADAVRALPLLGAVVDESMRLFPPAWIIPRAATEDTELGGYHIPAGSLVLTSPWVMHRHPGYWRDPEAFDPTRFLNGEAAALPRFVYYPFGGGPRLCIGKDFALLEARLILAELLRDHHVEARSATVPLATHVTLRPAAEVPVILRRVN